MILSHKHQFLFIKTEKTAGTSFEIGLSKFCGKEDIITPVSKKDERYRKSLGFTSARNYRLKPSGKPYTPLFKPLSKQKREALKKQGFYNHISAKELQPKIATSTWDNYFKFCFERNPFDKFVSWYFWCKGPEKYGSPLEFIKDGKAQEIRGRQLYQINGETAVDKVYKYEELSSALADLTERLELPEPLAMPPKQTKGGIRPKKAHYRDLLGSEERKLLEELFSWELQTFNYQF